MKTVTRYEASDGRTFKDPSKCRDHEQMIALSEDIVAPLGPRYKDTDDCNYANGGGFVQHDADVVEGVRARLIDAAQVAFNAGQSVNPGYLARCADDSGSPLRDAFWRLMCIDDQGREWGQPYFAANPDRGEQREIQR